MYWSTYIFTITQQQKIICHVTHYFCYSTASWKAPFIKQLQHFHSCHIMYQHIWEIVVYRAASQRLAASYCPSAASSTLASVQLERLWKEFQRDAPCESNNSTSYQGPFFEEVPHRSSSLSSATVNAGEPNRYSIKLLQRQKISRIQSGISNCNEFTDFFCL